MRSFALQRCSYVRPYAQILDFTRNVKGRSWRVPKQYKQYIHRTLARIFQLWLYSYWVRERYGAWRRLGETWRWLYVSRLRRHSALVASHLQRNQLDWRVRQLQRHHRLVVWYMASLQ